MAETHTLGNSELFQQLSLAQLDKIRRLGQLEEYQAGAAIFGERTPAGKLYVLEEGKVALQMEPPSGASQAGRRMTVDTVATGEVFGWSAVVGPQPYTLTAVCLEPTKVVAIDGKGLRTLMDDDHGLGYHVLTGLIKVVSSRLDETRQLLFTERIASA